MRRLLLLILSLTLYVGDAHAHGGTYVPPGDIVPPGGPPPSTTPTPPSTAPPTGPPTGTTPVTPPNQPNPLLPPNRPITPPGNRPGPVVTQPTALPPENGWTRWWDLNQDRYLHLRAEVFGRGNITTSSNALAGLGSGAEVAMAYAPTRTDRERIVRVLLAAARAEDNVDLDSAVLIATAKLRVAQPEVRAFILERLQSGSQEIQETAALALGLLRDAESLEVLRSMLEDGELGRAATGGARMRNRTRIFAAYGLALLGDALPEIRGAAASSLAAQLTDESGAQQELRIACMLALGLTGVDAPARWLPLMQETLLSADADSRVQAHAPRALVMLVKHLPPDAAAREQALALLLDTGANHGSGLVRAGALQVLGRLGHHAAPAANALILEALEHAVARAKQPGEKHFALISMAYLGAADPLGTRMDVETALGKLTRRGSTSIRPWAAMALGVLDFHLQESGQRGISLDSLATLREGFESTREIRRRSAYAIALGLAKDQVSAQVFAAELKDTKNSELAGYCAVALGMLDARAHAELLIERLQDSKRRPWLLRHLAIGLGLMGDIRGRDELLALIAPQDGSRVRLAPLSAATAGLGLVGDRETLGPLTRALQDDRLTPYGRAFAAVALGMVCDTDLLPWSHRVSSDLNYRASVESLSSPMGTGILDLF